MKLSFQEQELQLEFNTYGLNILTKLMGKTHPFEIFDDKLYLGNYENHIKVIQAGLSGAKGETISEIEACQAIDSLGGVQLVDWDEVYKELIEKSSPKELLQISEKYNNDKKKVSKPTRKGGQRTSSQPSKSA